MIRDKSVGWVLWPVALGVFLASAGAQRAPQAAQKKAAPRAK